MKLFGSDTNSGMIWKISDWFGMNFNPKLSTGKIDCFEEFKKASICKKMAITYFLFFCLNCKNFFYNIFEQRMNNLRIFLQKLAKYLIFEPLPYFAIHPSSVLLRMRFLKKYRELQKTPPIKGFLYIFCASWVAF